MNNTKNKINLLNKHPGYLNLVTILLFWLWTKYYWWGEGFLWFLVLLQSLKVLLIDESIFKGQGIFSYTFLLFLSWFIFIPYNEARFTFGAFGMLFLWLGMFHFQKVIKPFNSVGKNQKIQEHYKPQEFELEEDSHLFIKEKKGPESKEENIEDLLDQLNR